LFLGAAMAYEFHNIPVHKGFFFFGLIGSCIIAPVWFIYQFSRHLFESIEIFKLVGLCVGIGFPIVILNVGVLYLFIYRGIPYLSQKKHDENIRNLYLTSSVVTFVILYAPSVWDYLFCSLTLKTAIETSMITESLAISVLVIEYYWRKRKKIKQIISD
jgi:uncharacterized membrane protein